jgi:hypothetical protein
MAVEVLERHANVDEVLREVSRIKSIVTEAVEDGVKTALRTMKQGREATEDAIHDARHAIKRNPLQGGRHHVRRWNPDWQPGDFNQFAPRLASAGCSGPDPRDREAEI